MQSGRRRKLPPPHKKKTIRVLLPSPLHFLFTFRSPLSPTRLRAHHRFSDFLPSPLHPASHNSLKTKYLQRRKGWRQAQKPSPKIANQIATNSWKQSICGEGKGEGRGIWSEKRKSNPTESTENECSNTDRRRIPSCHESNRRKTSVNSSIFPSFRTGSHCISPNSCEETEPLPAITHAHENPRP